MKNNDPWVDGFKFGVFVGVVVMGLPFVLFLG